MSTPNSPKYLTGNITVTERKTESFGPKFETITLILEMQSSGNTIVLTKSQIANTALQQFKELSFKNPQ